MTRTQQWFDRARRWVEGLAAPGEPPTGAAPDSGRRMLHGLAGHSPEIADVQEQVATEQQGRIALVSRREELNCQLLAALREQAPALAAGTVTHEGFFTLVALPDTAASPPELTADEYGVYAAQHWTQEEIVDLLEGADVILYLADAAAGWQQPDDRWFARLRVSAAPVLPVLAGSTQASAADLEYLRRHLGIKPILLTCPMQECESGGAAPGFQELVGRILEVRPRLAIPLAREVPACRQMIARRVIRGGAFMAALLGLEPLPLLDLPLTVLVQWKMALQLAAIHGRPGVEVTSREMAGTIGLNLIVRMIAQQALKLIPIFGWMLSSALNFGSTWLLGQALLSLYGEQQPPAVRTAMRTALCSWRGKLAAGLHRLPTHIRWGHQRKEE